MAPVANQRLLNSENAVLCEFTADAFSGAIRSLIDDDDKRRSLGENGYRLYLDKYNFSTFTDQLDAAYAFVTSRAANG